MADGATDEAVRKRLRELSLLAPDSGYRALHASLQKEEPFKNVGLKRVQKLHRELRDGEQDAPSANAAPAALAGGGGADGSSPSSGLPRITLSRHSLDQRFGMMIEQEAGAGGGHAVTAVVEGGLAHAWNQQHPESRISVGDVVSSVNGKTTFSTMMDEFKQALSCTLEISRSSADGQHRGPELAVDTAEAEKEKAAWEQRRARVTAALIPGLKKIIDHEFGPGAGERIQRVDHLYQRVGRNEVFEDDLPVGRRYAPGYMEGLQPTLPFHDTKDHPWCAALEKSWKGIWTELRGCLADESLWTPGAYAASNEAYGKDWKIMGVFTADKWQDEQRFAATTSAVRQLQGVVPSEVFFARMPPHTEIAPHSDNLNYILTSHLPLDFEEGKCSITVGNEERSWKHGEMLVIDTSFIHSTKNESARPRYIMVLRFWHPGLTEEERRAIHLSHQILAGSTRKS